MRFEISETVHAPDPEMVLRVLEMCSKNISSDVVRYGDRITLHGLGPSPRSKNVHDTTVFCVNAEDDKTIINGEVNFQASALLGNVSQCDVVRSKIDQLFEQVKTQLDIEATQVRVAAPVVDESVAAAPLSPLSSQEELVEIRDSTDESVVADVAPVVDAVDVVESEPMAVVEEIAPSHLELKSWVKQEQDEPIASKRRVGGWAVGLAALFVLVVGGLFFYRHYVASASLKRTVAQTVAPRVVDAVPARARDSGVGFAGNVVDPKVWLQGWVAAMRTHDAAAQAAFYADPVDRYLGKHNVSRDDVLKDRAATMHMRQGTWTVKIEKIVVEQKSDTEAQVRLVKHFSEDTAPAEILELFVPSKLTLKRVGESWKISSEQDLPASSPAFEDSQKQ